MTATIKTKKHIGIKMNCCVYGKKNITKKEYEKFLDNFIELVEKKNWYVGGGFGREDLNDWEFNGAI